MDISPLKQVPLFGYPHVERLSTGIHDPLMASALWLDHDGVQLLMVALDLLCLDPPTSRTIRHRVSKALGIPEAAVFISCTHTHSGPVTIRLLGWTGEPPPDPAYLQQITDGVVRAAETALANVVPAELAWTVADATGVGGNRLKAGGITDPECGVLAIRHAETRKLMAVSLIYGMHPTVLHEDSTRVSSDFPYFTRLHVRENCGQDVKILYHTAPCGNQSPRHYVNGQTFSEAERLGRKLGGAIVRAIQDLPATDWCSTPTLAAALQAVTLPRRSMPSLPEAQAVLRDYQRTYRDLKAAGAPRPEIRTAECAVFGAESSVALAEAAAKGEIRKQLDAYEPIEIQALRVGEVVIVGLPGECFTEYALAIKKQSAHRTLVVSLVNGELQGYIVTPEAATAGGYEATNAMFAPEAGAILVEKAVGLTGRLF